METEKQDTLDRLESRINSTKARLNRGETLYYRIESIYTNQLVIMEALRLLLKEKK